MLWSDRPDDRARHSLRQCVLALRKDLGAASDAVLSADDETLSLDKAALEVDALTFEAAASTGSRMELERASSLYNGDLLEYLNVQSEEFESWLRDERSRYRGLAVEVFGALSESLTEAGEGEAAMEACQRLLTIDPLHEPAHRLTMRLLAGQGRRAEALRQFQRCAEALRADLGAEPEAETQRLFDEIRSESFEALDVAGTDPSVPQTSPTSLASAASPTSPADIGSAAGGSEGLKAAKRLWFTMLLTWRRSLDLLRAILTGARQGLGVADRRGRRHPLCRGGPRLGRLSVRPGIARLRAHPPGRNGLALAQEAVDRGTAFRDPGRPSGTGRALPGPVRRHHRRSFDHVRHVRDRPR